MANLLLVAAEVPYVMKKCVEAPGYFWRLYLPYNGAILASYGLMAATPKRSPRIGAMGILLLIYGWVAATGRV